MNPDILAMKIEGLINWLVMKQETSKLWAYPMNKINDLVFDIIEWTHKC